MKKLAKALRELHYKLEPTAILAIVVATTSNVCPDKLIVVPNIKDVEV